MGDAQALGPHVLLEPVGTGRHGTVHRARDAQRAGRVVADALAALHADGLVHGGPTAADVLLDPGDEPRLADGGLARLVGEQAATDLRR